MGVYGVYTAVDDETFKQISFLNKEKLPVQIAELEKKDDVPSCDLGKLWDGLHYLLTGIRTQDAVDEGLHSEVILGIKPLKIGYDFASGIPAADVVRIADAIELVDINALIRAADFQAFEAAGVYPAIWDEDPELLRDELTGYFHQLRDFYRQARDRGHSVIVGIW
ncbi:MAG: YfbM family protein [Propionibacteriaceae bacterium]|jgi:protein yfbM|nr:YfbM family protein [Propionibacteriaceae bacterium]